MQASSSQDRSAIVVSASSTPPAVADRPKRQRAARTNRPLAHLDKTTARGRRVADLVRALSEALGEPAAIERQADIVTAAELAVLAEEARTEALAGTGDLEIVVRLQGSADRAFRRLGLKSATARRDQTTLADYLAKRAAEAASAKNAGSVE